MAAFWASRVTSVSLRMITLSCPVFIGILLWRTFPFSTLSKLHHQTESLTCSRGVNCTPRKWKSVVNLIAFPNDWYSLTQQALAPGNPGVVAVLLSMTFIYAQLFRRLIDVSWGGSTILRMVRPSLPLGSELQYVSVTELSCRYEVTHHTPNAWQRPPSYVETCARCRRKRRTFGMITNSTESMRSGKIRFLLVASTYNEYQDVFPDLPTTFRKWMHLNHLFFDTLILSIAYSHCLQVQLTPMTMHGCEVQWNHTLRSTM